jgi:carboxylesterase type B
MTSLNAVKFQDAVRTLKKPFPGAKNPPIYFWNPTLDYDLIADYTLNELNAGHFINVPTIFGSAQHDGINFTPKNIKSLPSAQEFLIDQFPNLDWRPIREAWNVPKDASGDAQWRAVTSDVYGNIRYNCPSLNITSTYALNKSTPTWLYRWDVGSASHVGELMRIWNDDMNATSAYIQSYWASFIRSYDPNTYAAEYLNATGSGLESPEWLAFSNTDGKRLEFKDNNNVTMDTIPEEEWHRCNVIEEMGVHLKQPAYDPERHSFGIRQQPIASVYMVLATAMLGLFQWICV